MCPGRALQRPQLLFRALGQGPGMTSGSPLVLHEISSCANHASQSMHFDLKTICSFHKIFRAVLILQPENARFAPLGIFFRGVSVLPSLFQLNLKLISSSHFQRCFLYPTLTSYIPVEAAKSQKRVSTSGSIKYHFIATNQPSAVLRSWQRCRTTGLEAACSSSPASGSSSSPCSSCVCTRLTPPPCPTLPGPASSRSSWVSPTDTLALCP